MKPENVVEKALSLPQQRYLEVVSGLLRERGIARVKDVAERLGVSLPSVSEAVKRLVEMGVVGRDARHGIALRAAGREMAEQLEERHQALKRFMVEVMAMTPERADDVACHVEHCVDRDFAVRLTDLAGFLEREYPWTLKGIADHVREKHSERAAGAAQGAGI